MIKIQTKTRSFTIIETLVAITVLMIAVAGPLTIAGKSLTSALDAKNTLIATYLAQESMEYLNFLKDIYYNSPAIISQLDSNCTTSDCGASPKHVNPAQGIVSNVKKCNDGFENCLLFYSSDLADGGYTYKKDNGISRIPTIFTRKFRSSVVGADRLITVVVSWNTGSVQNQIKLQQIMSFASRAGM